VQNVRGDSSAPHSNPATPTSDTAARPAGSSLNATTKPLGFRPSSTGLIPVIQDGPSDLGSSSRRHRMAEPYGPLSPRLMDLHERPVHHIRSHRRRSVLPSPSSAPIPVGRHSTGALTGRRDTKCSGTLGRTQCARRHSMSDDARLDTLRVPACPSSTVRLRCEHQPRPPASAFTGRTV
jgi:hypothetical protein